VIISARRPSRIHIIAIMKVTTTMRGSGVEIKGIPRLSFRPSIQRKVKRLMARLKIQQTPKTYIVFVEEG
jgi:hypothetical protein